LFDSHYGYCDWVASHIDEVKIPYWITQRVSRPLTYIDSKLCDAWEPKP
jgi:hypothetical protein